MNLTEIKIFTTLELLTYLQAPTIAHLHFISCMAARVILQYMVLSSSFNDVVSPMAPRPNLKMTCMICALTLSLNHHSCGQTSSVLPGGSFS